MNKSSLLTINCGSSSVKFKLFSCTNALSLLASGKVINLTSNPEFIAVNEVSKDKKIRSLLATSFSQEDAIEYLIGWLNEQEQNWVINAVAHRIVHGGELFTSSVLLNEEIINKLKQLNCLAPLHQPHNLAAVEIIKKSHPQLAQIACFDTAFHADHSPFFTTYALPQTIRSQGVRRYGFHGLSYEWIVEVLKHQYPEIASKRIIAAHLGNGSSLCAIHHGLSIDTTMGLTALDGVPMGSRSGSIDPGAIIYMIRNLNLSPDNVEQILYNQSGLLGLSGQTNDVQQLEENKGVNAQFALDFFCLKTAQFIAMMAISLGGVDGIVFTGGIGENSEKIRSSILEKIECLKPFSVYIIPANEEKMMAMHALNILAI